MTSQEIKKNEQSEVARRDSSARDTYLPRADIRETPEDIRLVLDMPGVDSESIDINVERNTLAIHGEIKSDVNGKLLYAEHRDGDFYREFTLSQDLDTSRIEAACKNGILEVTIPKAEEVKPRKIKINS